MPCPLFWRPVPCLQRPRDPRRARIILGACAYAASRPYIPSAHAKNDADGRERGRSQSRARPPKFGLACAFLRGGREADRKKSPPPPIRFVLRVLLVVIRRRRPFLEPAELGRIRRMVRRWWFFASGERQMRHKYIKLYTALFVHKLLCPRLSGRPVFHADGQRRERELLRLVGWLIINGHAKRRETVGPDRWEGMGKHWRRLQLPLPHGPARVVHGGPWPHVTCHLSVESAAE